MKNSKVELLAPAGNMECFLAAIKAGADAVYLAGNRFGARAHAENFTTEQLIHAISYAHLFHKKVYMTVNTLLKPGELEELVSYMIPYYEAGLDGAIIQDMGVFEVLKRNFPGLELHCSTQMTLTGPEGAAFAIGIGASRIVPAREIDLSEIRQIHDMYPDLELECFIHGALCYCYSGQCLFSSIVGGRSGNRGTCAQPCRLPYTVAGNDPGKTGYPLSLKDLCTINIIPDLIEAGIASFKIEGRMKSAEYVAGVTGIYRAVIDRYYEKGRAAAVPDRQEMAVLSELYVRSETAEGYYHQYNGKNMITHDKPSYIGCSEQVLDYVKKYYMSANPVLPVNMEITLKTGENALLKVHGAEDNVTVQGEIVSKAQKKPLTEADIKKQLSKTGGTVFYVHELQINADDNIFMPISALNELRRLGIEKYQNKLLKKGQRSYTGVAEELSNQAVFEQQENADAERRMGYSVSVRTVEQLMACLAQERILRIYIEDPLWEYTFSDAEEICLKKNADRLYAALPRVIRARNKMRIRQRLNKLIREKKICGVYVSVPDAYQLAYDILSENHLNPRMHMIASPFFGVMNPESAEFWGSRCNVISASYELNEKELLQLFRETREKNITFEMPVYGRIPLMITANCIRKTTDDNSCRGDSGMMYIRDRRQNLMPVIQDCINCNNIIYNSVVLSLHRHLQKIEQMQGIGAMLLSFTTEGKEETTAILDYFENGGQEMPFEAYTNGHYTRGVQ